MCRRAGGTASCAWAWVVEPPALRNLDETTAYTRNVAYGLRSAPRLCRALEAAGEAAAAAVRAYAWQCHCEG